MNKRIFVLLVALMGIALVGIITVQIFWIKNSIEMREQQFSTSVKYALAKVSENIQKREFKENITEFAPYLDSMQHLKQRSVKDVFFQKTDTSRHEVFTFRQRILETNYKMQFSPFESDTINFRSFISEEESQIISEEESQIEKIEFKSKDFTNLSSKDRVKKIERLDKFDKMQFEDLLQNLVTRRPIYNRVSNNEIRINIDNELRFRNIETNFEYGVFTEELITKVKSDKFKKQEGYNYKVPLFVDSDGYSDYDLHVIFPEKKGFILSTISWLLLLSALFIFIIILAFASALYQLIRQKRISEIKTDFINNMTHEFKTPIATINLAIDSIKNPQIIDNKNKVLRYIEMIREENKRMHAQVENVLRISKLEKNQLDFNKEVIDIHDVIEDAISHVDLLIINKNGYVKKHFNSEHSEILGSEFHFTNVITNILDNAIKYSGDVVEIDVYTENAGNNILIKIKDQGIGMGKNVQKKIFDKFYREHGGNIHNVKGHGLGLSYVKSITEAHQGSVHVESEKGKGSTFIIKLPII